MNLSEHEIIRLVRERSHKKKNNLTKGIGDDCAVFGSTKKGLWLVTTDTLVDTIHFNRDFHPPHLLGRKCIAVNLSDIAAMGGIPRFVLVSVSLPSNIDTSWLTQWFDGVNEIIDEYDCCLIGGDTVQARELSITVTLLGEPGPGGTIFRSGACENDTVYVSGFLGDSATGLQLLQNQSVDPENKKWAELIDIHLNPTPQVDVGLQLAQSGFVTSMQDISDGLATDLSHICHESNVGAVLTQNSLPQSPNIAEAAKTVGKDVLDLQLFSGEDYQLVFTVKQSRGHQVESMISESLNQSIYAVGRITKGSGVFLEKNNGECVDISFKGYEHAMK